MKFFDKFKGTKKKDDDFITAPMEKQKNSELGKAEYELKKAKEKDKIYSLKKETRELKQRPVKDKLQSFKAGLNSVRKASEKRQSRRLGKPGLSGRTLGNGVLGGNTNFGGSADVFSNLKGSTTEKKEKPFKKGNHLL